MVVRFNERLEIRDLPPPPSGSSLSEDSSSSTNHSINNSEILWDRRNRSVVSPPGYSRQHLYLPKPPSRRGQMTSPVQLRAESLLVPANQPGPHQQTSYDGRGTVYDPVYDPAADPQQLQQPHPPYHPTVHQQPQQPDRPILQQTAVINWAVPPGYRKVDPPKEKSRIQKLGESWLFLTCLRTACLIITLSAVFACAFSQHWTEKAPVVLALVFSILSALVMGAAISVIFVWEMREMNMAKRILFTVIFAILSLTAAVLYTVGVSVCSSYNQYGCFVTNMSPALKVAAAFSYIALVLALVDCGLTFYFYKFDPIEREGVFTPYVSDETQDGRPPLPPPIHTEV